MIDEVEETILSAWSVTREQIIDPAWWAEYAARLLRGDVDSSDGFPLDCEEEAEAAMNVVITALEDLHESLKRQGRPIREPDQS